VERLNKERGMSILYTAHYMEKPNACVTALRSLTAGGHCDGYAQNLIGMLGGGIIQVGMVRVDENIESGDGFERSPDRFPIFRRSRQKRAPYPRVVLKVGSASTFQCPGAVDPALQPEERANAFA
jgi:hypothetical protein